MHRLIGTGFFLLALLFLSLSLPEVISSAMFCLFIPVVSAIAFSLVQKQYKVNETKAPEPFTPHSVKHVTSVATLPDDLANSLVNQDERKQWDHNLIEIKSDDKSDIKRQDLA